MTDAISHRALKIAFIQIDVRLCGSNLPSRSEGYDSNALLVDKSVPEFDILHVSAQIGRQPRVPLWRIQRCIVRKIDERGLRSAKSCQFSISGIGAQRKTEPNRLNVPQDFQKQAAFRVTRADGLIDAATDLFLPIVTNLSELLRTNFARESIVDIWRIVRFDGRENSFPSGTPSPQHSQLSTRPS